MADGLLGCALALCGAVHLVPATGALSANRLRALYGVDAADPVTLLLLRHRALLFGVLGTGFLYAAFNPAWRVAASVVALFCMLSFVLLARREAWPPSIRRVVKIDIVLSALLGVALAWRLLFDG